MIVGESTLNSYGNLNVFGRSQLLLAIGDLLADVHRQSASGNGSGWLKLCVGWIKALVFTPDPPRMFPGKVDSLSLNLSGGFRFAT